MKSTLNHLALSHYDNYIYTKQNIERLWHQVP